MKNERQRRIATYEVTAKCFDGKIVTRTEKFRQIHFRNNPSVVVYDDGSVNLNDAIELVKSWNNQVGNVNYTYSLNLDNA